MRLSVVLVSLSTHDLSHICLDLAVITFDEFTSITKLLLKVARSTQVLRRRVQEYLGVYEGGLEHTSASQTRAGIPGCL